MCSFEAQLGTLSFNRIGMCQKPAVQASKEVPRDTSPGLLRCSLKTMPLINSTSLFGCLRESSRKRSPSESPCRSFLDVPNVLLSRSVVACRVALIKADVEDPLPAPKLPPFPASHHAPATSFSSISRKLSHPVLADAVIKTATDATTY
jgi:hypothetical protein